MVQHKTRLQQEDGFAYCNSRCGVLLYDSRAPMSKVGLVMNKPRWLRSIFDCSKSFLGYHENININSAWLIAGKVLQAMRFLSLLVIPKSASFKSRPGMILLQ